jgi:hypothetical protein
MKVHDEGNNVGDSPTNTVKIWHKQQEEILKQWCEIGSCFRFMHDRAFTTYEKKNFRYAIPVIIISTVTGTANFAQGTFPIKWQPYVPLVIGFLNLSAGLLTTVSQFLRVSELLEGHRAASIAYSKFSRNIAIELLLPRNERTSSGREYVNMCRSELDRLIEQTPNIPEDIIKRFGKKFKDTGFRKPDILTISPVTVFEDTKTNSFIDKLKNLKQQESIKRELMETEQLRRNSVMDELIHHKQVTEQIINEDKLHRKDAKKKAVGILSVNDNMTRLLKKLEDADQRGEVITPESSDTDDANVSIVIHEVSET